MESIRVTPNNNLIKVCCETLTHLGYSLQSVDRKQLIIIAEKGVSALSWGKKVEIKLKLNKRTTTVVVACSNTMSLEIDLGGNNKVERHLINEITKSLTK